MFESIWDIIYKEVVEFALEPLIVHSQLKIIYINGAPVNFFRASKRKSNWDPLDIFRDNLVIEKE